jgi:hypothetical protein
MKVVYNLSITSRAAAIFDAEARKLRRGEVIALYYLPSFTNADGSTVAEFLPGYTIDRVKDRVFDDPWLLAQLPNGLTVRLVPRLIWQDNDSYLLDRESGYTFSIRQV